jgi:hypothetical protein
MASNTQNTSSIDSSNLSLKCLALHPSFIAVWTWQGRFARHPSFPPTVALKWVTLLREIGRAVGNHATPPPLLLPPHDTHGPSVFLPRANLHTPPAASSSLRRPPRASFSFLTSLVPGPPLTTSISQRSSPKFLRCSKP